MNGVLPINKPQGITSAQALAKARFLLSEDYRNGSDDNNPIRKKIKIGHSGTLDPMATGILPMMIGEATAFIQFMPSRKNYHAAITFGIQTDTDDADGKVIAQAKPPTDIAAAVQEVLPRYCGLIEQTAPAYSALKYRGKPLYYYARNNIAAPNKKRQVQVHNITMQKAKGAVVELAIDCESGFYVRSLANALGKELKCGAHLSALHRTLSGGFRDAISLSDLADMKPDERRNCLQPIESALQHLPICEISIADAQRMSGEKKVEEGELVRLFVGERFAGLGCRDSDNIYHKKMLSWTRNTTVQTVPFNLMTKTNQNNLNTHDE